MIILLLVILVIGILNANMFKENILLLMEFGNQYAGLLTILTSLILAYVTWSYVEMGRKTLEFMKESFEKESEEDIKFMFIKQSASEIEEELIENEQLLVGSAVQPLQVAVDDSYIYINIFNSGRRLISHLQFTYRVEIINPDNCSVYQEEHIKAKIPVTVAPNDYCSFPLVQINHFPKVRIVAKSLRSYNGLGKEQLFNSPQRHFEYKNQNLED